MSSSSAATSRVQRLEHAELYVEDLDRALEFYTGVMGLQEIHREGDAVYLGCNPGENFDMALREGRTGVVHFAIRVDSEDDLSRYQTKLQDQKVTVEETTGREPGEQRSLRFMLPSEHVMELVVVPDKPSVGDVLASSIDKGFRPLDIDHINLLVDDVKALVSFLTDVLEFRLSDVIEVEGGMWPAAWTRLGDFHHDVGMFARQTQSETLHHLAWTMDDLEHIKRAADLMAGVGTPLELGPSRHPVGRNLFAYFLEPGGNRFELSAEGAVLNQATPTGVWRGLEDTLDAWGDLHLRLPDTFLSGS